MEHENEDSLPIEVSPAEVVADDSSIQTQVATARRWPRNIKRATQNAIALVTLDQQTAATCIYSVPRGGKKISGPSVHLAKILAQQFGNMRIDARVVNTDGKNITSMGLAWDLETNLAIRVEVKRSILDKHGRRYSEDLVTVTGNAANAIALRNAVFAVIPRAVVDKVMNAAKGTITGDISDKNKLIAKRAEQLAYLKNTYSVTEIEILAAIGKASVDFIDGDDLVTLVGFDTSIKDGDATVDNIFRGKQTADKEGAVTLEDIQMLYAEVEDKMTPKLKTDADRIIKNKEENSYKKLHKQLSEIK